MGLLKRLMEKKREYQKGREAEKIYSRERQLAYEQSYHRGRLAGAKKAGYKAGYKRATEKRKPWYEHLGDVSTAMERSLDPTGTFSVYRPKSKKKKKRKKGTTITVNGTKITISKGKGKTKSRKRKKNTDEWLW